MMSGITFETADMIDRVTGGIFTHAEKMLASGDENALRICLDIITFVQELGAVTTDDHGAKKADFKIILQFFCGVLRYTPEELRHARIDDLSHAFAGYKKTFRQEGLQNTLSALMKKFPDGETA